MSKRHVVALLMVCLSLASMPAQAQVTVLQTRGSNITNGPVSCTGQETLASIIFNGSSALPAAANTFVVGADIIVQQGILQHAFVGVDPGSITPSPGGISGNGLLVTLGAGEVHRTNLFPFNSSAVNEVAGFRLNTVTPQINVSFACTQGFFQGQIFVYFIQF